MEYPKNMAEFMEKFHSKEKCLEFLEELRFPDGCICQKCGWKDFWKHGNRGYKVCRSCRTDLRITAWTVLHKIRTPLVNVFLIAWFLVSSKRWISAEELSHTIQVSQSTTWTWLQKFRRIMVLPWRRRLEWEVEVDEVFVGWKHPGKRWRWAEWKKKVVIAVEANKTNENDFWEVRGMGRVRMRVIPNCSQETLTQFIQENIEQWSCIYTDKWRGYTQLEDKGYFHVIEEEKKHKDIEWTHKDWVTPNVHIIASLLKRWLLWTHQKYLARGKHLDYYLDEYTFRFNRRKSGDRWKLFLTLMKEIVSQKFTTYDQIILKK